MVGNRRNWYIALCLAMLFTRHRARRTVVVLGAARRVAYSKVGDPAGALAGETELKVRALVVDGAVKEWTTGDAHDVTDRSFVVRRAIKLNDSLPSEGSAPADKTGDKPVSGDKPTDWR